MVFILGLEIEMKEKSFQTEDKTLQIEGRQHGSDYGEQERHWRMYQNFAFVDEGEQTYRSRTGSGHDGMSFEHKDSILWLLKTDSRLAGKIEELT